ncbi:MAG TPA: UDP-N-acetylmuramoyl-L-alanyl-D-glutamate--2,6-diaminopimelate ligase [Flavobacteriaceae bacterium]|nr:UDP-N-acetylmuramoyl-L-alanyl-D-glutamate--2,6-diaminopimelate ligase [Flavobacteriaceae bacterium]
MKNLKEILFKVTVDAIYGDTSTIVKDICFSSKKAKKNSLFIAINGYNNDGHDFVNDAIDSGATTIVCEKLPKDFKNLKSVFVKVKCSKSALSIISSNFYDNPSSKIDLIGITGTNGKTTISSLLYKLFNKFSIDSGLISTIDIKYKDQSIESINTTPDSISINYHLSQMVKSNVKICFMEVSSHGIDQKRIEGLLFKGVIFTNLTHDHIDYHKSFANYRDTKKKIFDSLSNKSFSLINSDDRNSKYIIQNSKSKKYTYGIKSKSDYSSTILELQLDGMLLNIDNNEIWTKLIGEFNAYNILAIYSLGKIYELETIRLLKSISELENVQGRLQSFITKNKITVIVDYAHTPDALENVLKTINKIRTVGQRLITVVGCGGDRDTKKRPLIGNLVSELSSYVIFTSDNPRSENPNEILEQILLGVSGPNSKKTDVIVKREKAIEAAYKYSDSGDIVLIAGKGHENYQELNGKRIPFDDFKIAKQIFK